MKAVKKAALMKKNNVNFDLPVVNIIINYGEWKKIESELTPKINEAVVMTLKELKFPIQIELSIRLTCDAEMKDLNKKYRGKPEPTNVLAFPQDSDSSNLFNNQGYLGDIAIGYQSVDRESLNQNKSLCGHLIHLIIHGLLHLFGYNHNNEMESKIMEQIEIDVLCFLGYKNPYCEELTKYS